MNPIRSSVISNLAIIIVNDNHVQYKQHCEEHNIPETAGEFAKFCVTSDTIEQYIKIYIKEIEGEVVKLQQNVAEVMYQS